MPMDNWRENLLKIMRNKGFDMKGLCLRAGLDPSTISKMIKRKSVPQITTMTAIAKALDVSLDEIMSGVAAADLPVRRVPIYGQVAAGLWVEDGVWDEPRYEDVSIVTGKYANLEQKGYKVVGDSMDKEGIADGSYVITVLYWQVRDRIQDGDVVVVERGDGKRIERTVKVVSIMPNEYRLEPRSSNPHWNDAYISIPRESAGKPHEANDMRIEIVGLVIGMYKSFG